MGKICRRSMCEVISACKVGTAEFSSVLFLEPTKVAEIRHFSAVDLTQQAPFRSSHESTKIKQIKKHKKLC